MMKDKEWLDYHLNPSGKWMDYYPGTKLVKYINKEKSLEELATRIELDEVESRLQARINALEESMKRVINIIDPPVSQEKESKYLKGGYDNAFQALHKTPASKKPPPMHLL